MVEVQTVNSRRWMIGTIILTGILLAFAALPTILVDPYFHYHKPIEGITYLLNDQRYQNDGILKHFSYDAVITGSSMTENFKTSDMDQLFGTTAVKTPFSGGSYKEIRDNLDTAFENNSEIRYVIRSIDCPAIIQDKDAMRYEDALYPFYLYDDKMYNDVSYFLNKQVLFEYTVPMLAYTRAGIESTSFDEYCYWSDEMAYGKEAILKKYNRPEKTESDWNQDTEDFAMLHENIQQNFIAQARQYPDTQFYYFFTPQSIFWWDSINQMGAIEQFVVYMQEASRIMLEYENIHLYSFFDVTELICNPEHYNDTIHHSGEINTQLLHWMKNGEHQLDKENYQDHWNEVLEFYGSYDYEALFAS